MRAGASVSELALMAAPLDAWLKRNGQAMDCIRKSCFDRFLGALAAELETGGLCVELERSEAAPLLMLDKLFTDIHSKDFDRGTTPFVWEALEADRVRVYMRRFYACESSLANQLARFCRKTWVGDFDRAISRARGIGLAQAHPRLCDIVFQKGLTVLYGGPGTGKTTQLALVLESLLTANPNLRVALAAPTGKASSRMKLAIVDAIESDANRTEKRFSALALKCSKGDLRGLSAATIHRWLLSEQENGQRPSADAPLECDLFVVDEASMVDIEIAQRLFSVLDPERTRVILMGDAYQLQAVGPGSFFGDLCRFGSEAPHRFAYGLEKTYRFDPTSPVGQLAAAVKQEMQPVCEVQDVVGAVSRSADCQDPQCVDRPLTRGEDSVMALQKWLAPYMATYARALKGGDTRTIWEALSAFRILCATRHGPCGVEKLNRIAVTMLREALGGEYRENSGVPIIVRANDAQRGVFNGDVGVILPKKASDDSMEQVVFGDILDENRKVLEIPLGVLPAYETAFAITVHKAQGSEFPHVALFMPQEANNPLTTSELFYTGLTRVLDRKNTAHQIEQYGTLTIFASEEVEQKARSTRPVRAGGFLTRMAECLGEES